MPFLDSEDTVGLSTAAKSFVEGSRLVLCDRDLDLVAADPMPSGKSMRGFPGKVFLDNPPLTKIVWESMLGSGLSP